MFENAIAQAAASDPSLGRVMPTIPGLMVHIDGDYLAYHAAGNDGQTAGGARDVARERIKKFKAVSGAETAVVHLTAANSCKGSRYLVATVKPYQEQRKGNKKPKNQPYLQDYLMRYEGSEYRSKTWTNREADDGMGAMSLYATTTPQGYAVIATADKDMRMMPGVHIDWNTFDLTRVNPGDYDVIGKNGKQYGLKWLWLQMLHGDGADNIPGLEYCWWSNGAHLPTRLVRCGPAKAEHFLKGTKTHEEGYNETLSRYRAGYNTSPEYANDRFVEQLALLWMRLGPYARLLDFAEDHRYGAMLQFFDDGVLAACERLEKRVGEANATLNQLRG